MTSTLNTPRVACPEHGVRVIELPWAEKYSRFTLFWKSRDKQFAEAHFRDWFAEALKSGLKPMIKAAKTLKRHLYGLLAWFDSRITNSVTEGYNATIQALKAGARGFRNFENFRIVILFYCGKLDMRPDFVRVGSVL